MTDDKTGSYWDTKDHIYRVRELMHEAVSNLTERYLAHDKSKLVEPEKSAFDRLKDLNELSDLKYGSDEYKAALNAERPAIVHHYAHNDHHPEYHAMLGDRTGFDKTLVTNGTAVSAMSLLSILEMLCDWKAAGERVKTGSLAESLSINRVRFGLSDQLYKILVNTAHELGWLE